MPPDRMAHRIPHVVHSRARGARRHRARAGRGRRRGKRPDRARPGGRRAHVGDEPLRREAGAGDGLGRGAGFRAGCAAPGAGRRRDGDSGGGDLVAFRQVAQARRHGRRERCDHRFRSASRAQPRVLPSAVGGRLDDGNARRARPAGAFLHRVGGPPGHLGDVRAQRRTLGLRGDARWRAVRQGRVHRLQSTHAEGGPRRHAGPETRSRPATVCRRQDGSAKSRPGSRRASTSDLADASGEQIERTRT